MRQTLLHNRTAWLGKNGVFAHLHYDFYSLTAQFYTSMDLPLPVSPTLNEQTIYCQERCLLKQGNKQTSKKREEKLRMNERTATRRRGGGGGGGKEGEEEEQQQKQQQKQRLKLYSSSSNNNNNNSTRRRRPTLNDEMATATVYNNGQGTRRG